ncbi:MAG TPA: hypothetical protein PLL26_02460 [Candidatus Dojkabacteria bacterium]|nr:hypothetical protein [Candidatus Dojkabacteria bacterium]
MSTPQEILQEMINAAPDQSEKLGTSISQIQTQIDNLQQKQDAMKSGVGDVATSRLESYLIGTKFIPVNSYHQYMGTTYNQILSSAGTLTDWKIYKIMNVPSLTYVSSSSFECSGDQTSVFTEDKDIALKNGSSFAYSTVSSSIYDPGLDTTTVDIADSVIEASLINIFEFHYQYTPGNDSTIDELITQWNFAHDYIVKPLGLSGSYGTQDNIAKLNDAKNMLLQNKSKVDNTEDIFSKYV